MRAARPRRSFAHELQIATLVVLAFVVFLLLSLTQRFTTMDSNHSPGIGQTIGHRAGTDEPIVTERLSGETIDEWLARHAAAVTAAGAE